MTEKNYYSFDLNCDPEACYNFNALETARIGHLLKLSFVSSKRDLKTDISIQNAENLNCKIDCAGVIENLYWDGNNKLSISGRISPKNKGIMLEGFSFMPENLDVILDFVIYDYDYDEKKYFKRFHTNHKSIECEISNHGSPHIYENGDSVVRRPINYQFFLPLKIKEGQELHWLCRAGGTEFSRKVKEE